MGNERDSPALPVMFKQATDAFVYPNTCVWSDDKPCNTASSEGETQDTAASIHIIFLYFLFLCNLFIISYLLYITFVYILN